MLSQLDQWSRRAVVASLVLLPIIIYAVMPIPMGSASVHEWLPDGREERQRYEQFLNQFGTDQFILISWDRCTFDDPRMLEFQRRVENQAGFAEPLIESVQSTRQALQSLTDDPINLSISQAARRFQGILVGRGGLCVAIAKITPYGLEHQAQVIEHLFQSADASRGLDRHQLRLAGTLYEAHVVDMAAERSLQQLVIPSMIIGILLACVCLRSIGAAFAVLILAGVGTLLAIATVTMSGGQFSAVLIVLPTLIFMLTLSGAVHLMHYYDDASAMHTDHLGSRAMLMGFKPSVLASVTTSMGMASLAASQLAPVREFGIYSSITLCIATTFLMLAFPALSDWFRRRKTSPFSASKKNVHVGKRTLDAPKDSTLDDHPHAIDFNVEVDAPARSAVELIHQAVAVIDADTHAAVISPLAVSYTAWMQRYAVAVSAVGFALIALSLYGLTFLQPSTKFDDMFPADSPTIRNMVWFEQNVGPIASVEVLLHFPHDSALDVYDRLQWVERVGKSIRSDARLGNVLSATTFLPELPQTGSLRDVARRSVLRSKLAGGVPMLAERGWIAESPQGQVWRVTAKVSATSDEDYGVLTSLVTERVHSTPRGEGEPVPFDVEVTGLYPVMHKTQLALIDDLGISFSAAFILITPVMMWIARSFWAGLLIMVPNVLPETLVFGCMAWLGFRLDIAGLLTASVAMGIAVTDTLHFVNWYARRLAAGDAPARAVADTLSCCAAAMFHTMLISCCSMLPFLFADFMPTRQFAMLMIAMLGSAILGDLVLLPALLLSPLGLCLVPRSSRSSPTAVVGLKR